MTEIWKDIEGFEGAYQVSSFGRVKSLARTVVNHKSGSTRPITEKIIKVKIKPNGYCFVHLCESQKTKYEHVHRLVAKAFIPTENKKLEVNHLDFDKTNNHAENLEWVSPKENTQHSIQNFRNPRHKIILDIFSGVFYFSYREIAENRGVSTSCVHLNLSGERHNPFYKRYQIV